MNKELFRARAEKLMKREPNTVIRFNSIGHSSSEFFRSLKQQFVGGFQFDLLCDIMISTSPTEWSSINSILNIIRDDIKIVEPDKIKICLGNISLVFKKNYINYILDVVINE